VIGLSMGFISDLCVAVAFRREGAKGPENKNRVPNAPCFRITV
jgi:hypothetical protein